MDRQEALARRASLIKQRHEDRERQLAASTAAANAREQERSAILFIRRDGFFATATRLAGMGIPADLLAQLPSVTVRGYTTYKIEDVIEAANWTDSPALVGRLGLVEVVDLAGDAGEESIVLGIGPYGRARGDRTTLETAYHAAEDGVTMTGGADGIEVCLQGTPSRLWRWQGGGVGGLEGTLPVQVLLDFSAATIVGVRSLKHDSAACARWATVQAGKIARHVAALLSGCEVRGGIAGCVGAGECESLLRQAAAVLEAAARAITSIEAEVPQSEAAGPAANAGEGEALPAASAVPAPSVTSAALAVTAAEAARAKAHERGRRQATRIARAGEDEDDLEET
jgi:hypothetical protein